ncbi:hypothetical protein ACH5RR_009234 [Cinchona calisaya]|uniref:Uncharacterized protein n=1 Tax=Cinchona calisaya TaxID=153742 RepID=A0ABD3AGN0_9GENT
MSDEIPLIQRSRHLKKKFTSDERSTSAGDHDSDKCWKHIPSDRSPRDVTNKLSELVLNTKNLFTGVHSSNQTLDAIGDQLGSIHFIAEGTTLDGPTSRTSSDNTILGPSQFELVVRNLGKPSDLIPFSNVEKGLPMMATTPILAQPVPCALIAASIFSVIAITSEQHRKAALGIGEIIQQ